MGIFAVISRATGGVAKLDADGEVPCRFRQRRGVRDQVGAFLRGFAFDAVTAFHHYILREHPKWPRRDVGRDDGPHLREDVAAAFGLNGFGSRGQQAAAVFQSRRHGEAITLRPVGGQQGSGLGAGGGPDVVCRVLSS